MYAWLEDNTKMSYSLHSYFNVAPDSFRKIKKTVN
jgi:hypothetical protein